MKKELTHSEKAKLLRTIFSGKTSILGLCKSYGLSVEELMVFVGRVGKAICDSKLHLAPSMVPSAPVDVFDEEWAFDITLASGTHLYLLFYCRMPVQFCHSFEVVEESKFDRSIPLYTSGPVRAKHPIVSFIKRGLFPTDSPRFNEDLLTVSTAVFNFCRVVKGRSTPAMLSARISSQWSWMDLVALTEASRQTKDLLVKKQVQPKSGASTISIDDLRAAQFYHSDKLKELTSKQKTVQKEIDFHQRQLTMIWTLISAAEAG